MSALPSTFQPCLVLIAVVCSGLTRVQEDDVTGGKGRERGRGVLGGAGGISCAAILNITAVFETEMETQMYSA